MRKNDSVLATFTNRFEKFISNMAGSHLAFAQELYYALRKIEERERGIALWAICDLYGNVPPSEQASEVEAKYVDQIDDFGKKYLPFINKQFDSLINKNYRIETFYKKTCDFIFEEKKLDTEASRIYALCKVLLDSRTPYFKYDQNLLYSMSEDNFCRLINKLKEKRQLIHHFKSRNFRERTMQASVILNVFGINNPGEGNEQEKSDYEEKLILMCELLFSSRV